MAKIPGTCVRTDLRPGDLGYIIYLHGYFYSHDCGFGETFEPYVAISLSEFIRYRKERERLWIVEHRKHVAGSMAVVEHSDRLAHLRWFFLHPKIRGSGVATDLLGEAIEFCRLCEYEQIFVWTVDFLEAAKKLYRKQGFKLTEERKHPIWGIELNEQRYALSL
jgi:N-acetylglutamate synthase-like GNAT family acetyltransferase